METELKSFTRVTTEILGEELSEWLVKRGTDPIVEKDLGLKIKDLYKHMSGQERTITKSYLTNVVSHVRKYLETNYKKTLVNIKGVGFKIGTPKEATVYATQIYKSFLKRGMRVERAVPLIVKAHLPSSVDKVFGGSRRLLNDFTKGSQPLMLAFEEVKRGESNAKE
jgi:hypothetical protein